MRWLPFQLNPDLPESGITREEYEKNKESYRDEAVGMMMENERGSRWVGSVTLRPRIRYGGERAPTPEEEERLHHLSHEECIIANSVRTEVAVVPAGREA